MNWRKTISWLISPFHIMLLLVVAEIGFLTFWKNGLGMLLSPAVFFVVSILISLFPLIALKDHHDDLTEPFGVTKGDRAWFRTISFAIYIFVSVYMFFELRDIFNHYLPGEHMGIIPAVQTYVKQLVTGSFPYSNLQEQQVFYLPMMWLPFVLSEWARIDYRWTAYAVGMLGLLFYHLYIIKRSDSYTGIIIKSLAPFAYLQLLLTTEPEIFGYSIELLAVGFYMLLAYSLFQRSPVIVSIGLVLTLLSRFFLLLWVPVYWFMLFFNKKMGRLITIIAIVILSTSLIYVLPFLSQDWSVFKQALTQYTDAAMVEWDQSVPEEEGLPPNLSEGIGFAVYFHQFAKGTIDEKLKVAREAHFIITIMAAILAALIFIPLSKKIDLRICALLSLKFYLTFFYTFLQVPYFHLYMVPVFLSLFIFSTVSYKMKFKFLEPDRNTLS